MTVNPIPIPIQALAAQVATQVAGQVADPNSLRIVPAGTAAAGVTLAQWRAECVGVGDFGAVGDGVTDATNAFVAAFAWLAAHPGRVLLVPPGTYNLLSLSTPLIMPDRSTLRGAGMHRSRILWNDTAGIDLLQSGGTAAASLHDVVIEDLTITGSCAANWQATSGGYPVLLAHVQGITIRRVCSEWSRAMGIALRECDDVCLDNVLVRYSAFDGISVTACENVSLIAPVVEWTGDDAISWHSDTAETAPHGNLILTGFRIRHTAGGIDALGAKTCVIDGGIMELVRFQGISVGGANGATEGCESTFGVSISNVVIRDMLDASLSGDGASGCRALCISSAAAISGPLAAAPGLNDPTSGSVIPLAGYEDQNGAGPIAIGAGIAISNVQVLVGRAAVPAFSAYGLGLMFTRHGWIDPAVPRAALQPTALACLGGVMRDVRLQSCLFEGGGAAIAVYLAGGVRLLASRLVDCTFRDYGVALLLANGLPQDIALHGGLIDMDPYLTAPSRTLVNGKPDGTWQAGASTPMILEAQSSTGFLFDGVALRNLYGLRDAAFALWRGCWVQGDPAAIGYAAGNRGIAAFPNAGEGFRFVQLDGNPDSATFNQLVFQPPLEAGAQPSAGTWLAGQFVRASMPTPASGRITLGWMRLTTGHNHAAGTDWSPVVATTS